jgi:acetyl esterase/lipase
LKKTAAAVFFVIKYRPSMPARLYRANQTPPSGGVFYCLHPGDWRRQGSAEHICMVKVHLKGKWNNPLKTACCQLCFL